MRAKLLALAAGVAVAALPVAAHAQAKVTVYGLAHVSIDMMDADSATAADNGSRTSVSSNVSRLGIKAAADLGGGLKGIAQYEMTVATDGEGQATSVSTTTTVSGVTGATATSTSTATSSRLLGNAMNSFVGLEGGFGTILAGIHDTPLKTLGRQVEFFPEYIGDARNLTEQDLRPNNAIVYLSPIFSGASARLAYYADEDASKTQDGYSASVMYSGGPILAGGAYESWKNPSSYYKTLYRLVAQYKAGPVRVGGQYQQGSGKANVSGVDRSVWGLGASYSIGKAVLKGQYYSADDKGGTASSGATMYALGADYNLGSQTTVYLAYAKTDNDTNGAFTVNGSGAQGAHGDGITPKAGTSPSGFSIGMIQKF
ncbi:MAG: porin [Nitrospirae bacterium]|nr:porin [Nitrospirota bacterium]